MAGGSVWGGWGALSGVPGTPSGGLRPPTGGLGASPGGLWIEAKMATVSNSISGRNFGYGQLLARTIKLLGGISGAELNSLGDIPVFA